MPNLRWLKNQPDDMDKEQLTRNYDVFVYEYCTGALSQKSFLKNLTLDQSKSICRQLIEGLEELEQSNLCHNDLKPDNVFYKISDVDDRNEKYQIKIGDFGTAGRSGGTPGWTWPKFMTEREAGKSDMYSVALLILYILCKDRTIFYRLRDNYVEDDQVFLAEFRQEPLIELIMNMMTFKISVRECKNKWLEMSDYIENFIDDFFLCNICGIPRRWLEVQDNMDATSFSLTKATLLDE